MRIKEIKVWVSKEMRVGGNCCKIAIGASADIIGNEDADTAIKLLNMSLKDKVSEALGIDGVERHGLVIV